MFSMAAEDATRLQVLDINDLEETVKLVRYDARGHGESQATYSPDDYTWSNLGGDILAIADSLGADRVILGGASMGCGSSLYAALQAPERIAGLVLVLPPTAWEMRPAQARKYRLLATLAKLGLLRWLLPLLMRTQPLLPGFFLEDFPQADDILKQTMGSLDKRVYPPLLEGAARSDLPSAEQLRTIPIPTLILAWVDDEVHPVSSAERLHELLPNSTLHIAKTLEDYQRWPHHVVEFIKGIQHPATTRNTQSLRTAS